MSEEICPVKKFFIETEKENEFYLEQIPTSCLSQNAYYIECKGEAVIIDPMRDIENYLDLLKTRKAKLLYIIETHFHADFVSGHYELERKTGAKIIFGPNANVNKNAEKTLNTNKEIISEAVDNQILNLGNIKLKIIHTPGHTLESICILLIDKNGTEKALFSGDTIFLGEVGRPDLAVNKDLNLTEKDLAGYLWESLQKIKRLNENLIIFPGHSAGSACGKNITVGIGDSLKNQKINNYALSDNMNKEEFVNIASSNLSKPLSYFFHDVKLNKEGYESIDILLEKSLKPLKFEEFMSLAKEKDYIVIDTRISEEFSKGFFKGSYSISLKMTFAVWVATLFKPDNKLLLITEPGKEKESILRLFRVGYYNILGYLEGGFENFKQKNTQEENICKLINLNYDEIKKMFEEKKIDLVDIREISEFENTGIVENSNLIPLGDLEKKIEDFRKFKNPIGVFCRSGARAVIGGSILKKHGYENVFICGGFEAIKNKGIKCVKYLKK
jgi:glyoxylase-like metal-dependent hydrolase (beta-lactamase superfamily II)/rhodanese-related sulfurtransferase